MIAGSEELYTETKESLERIQIFDEQNLPREIELGGKLNFKDAVAPAKSLIELYNRLSPTALQDFPDNILTIIRDNANNHYNIFSQMLSFDADQQSPGATRLSLINSLQKAYQPAFQALHPYIAYSLHRSADFQRLDADARSTLQSIEDKSAKISERLATYEGDAKQALDEIRKVAAEEGITQQAAHFNAESQHHSLEAENWKTLAIRISFALGGFSVLSLFIHKIPFLKPENTYDAIQLSISKFLIFFVIAYMLFLSARNFLNHKHNAIVNKHRQNALMTHRALVEASGDSGVRDAVLLQASSCIFSPQPTGYTSGSDNDISTQKSMVEIFSKPITQSLTKQ